VRRGSIPLRIACATLAAACDPHKVTAPPPAISTPVQVRFTATGAPASACMPTISVSFAGPVGTRLTWVGMGLRVGWSPPYDENFDAAFTQRFWAGDGLAAGESTSSHSMLIGGSAPILITMRFRYTVTADATTHTDSVAVACT
jgi:hypothetical protein